VLIAPDGRVARVWEKAPAKGHAAEVLAALDSLS
jgi:peroxiredoxin